MLFTTAAGDEFPAAFNLPFLEVSKLGGSDATWRLQFLLGGWKMSNRNRSNRWTAKCSMIGKPIIGMLLACTLVLCGCGGYRAPTSTQMPGTTPKPYPTQRH
jgi:hypothetical protein